MTHAQRRPGRLFPAFAAPLVLAGLLTGSGTAAAAGAAGAGTAPAPARGAGARGATASAAAACPGWTVQRPAGPGAMTDDFFGAAALSPANVWAVGDYSGFNGPFRTLIEHWNGRRWSRVPSPNPGVGSDYLASVHAVSASNIWAAGSYSNHAGVFAADKTLILHWNGSRWSQVPSPSPGNFIDNLSGVHTLSAASAWAVGFYANSGGPDRGLILHWNGRRWSQVPSPNPGSKADVLNGVEGIAGGNVWAVGLYQSGLFSLSLVLHWNGHAWAKVASPNPTGSSELLGVDATSAANAWAVGDDGKGESVTLRWNGRTWTRVPSPDILPRGDDNILYSVAATSAANAWAVGAGNILGTGTAFELHWNGRTWTNMVSPNPGANSSMDAVAATSASNAWAVGEYGLNPAATTQRALVFHCK